MCFGKKRRILFLFLKTTFILRRSVLSPPPTVFLFWRILALQFPNSEFIRSLGVEESRFWILLPTVSILFFKVANLSSWFCPSPTDGLQESYPIKFTDRVRTRTSVVTRDRPESWDRVTKPASSISLISLFFRLPTSLGFVYTLDIILWNFQVNG